MLLEAKLLSKVLMDKEFWVLAKFNIGEEDFKDYGDVYSFIKEFVKEYGQTPDYLVVVEKFKKFDFQIEVFDTFPYLCKTLKKAKAKNKIFNVLQNQAGKNFKEKDIDDFISWIDEEVSAAKNVLKASSGMGTNYAANGEERKRRYQESKEQGSGMFIPTPYETLTRLLDGGFELGDYILLQAFSNKGKSWVASHIAVHAWQTGSGVLHYSPELSKSQQENRNDTLLGHFNNVEVRNGELENEAKYFEFLAGFEDNETPYIIKTMEDIDKLDVDSIEADLQMNPNIKMVVIDGFNLMTHGKGKLDRNAMTMTSRRLRQLFGKYKVVGVVVHQVAMQDEKENTKKVDDEVSPIPRKIGMLSVSESSALIQDACTVLGFDAVDGSGLIHIGKCRGTGKEKSVELNLNFNYGYITEASPVDFF